MTTYTPDGLLARFRGWTAPELPAARAALADELAAQRAKREAQAARTGQSQERAA